MRNALEELDCEQTEPQTPVEALSPEDILESSVELDHLGDEAQAIQSASDAADQIDGSIAMAEDSLEDGGMSEREQAQVAASVESLLTHLGYPKKKVMAKESFGGMTREQATIASIEELREINKDLRKKIQVAQEGLISRFLNAIERAFTSHDSVLRGLPGAIENLRSRGTNGELFKDAAWARIFISSGKSTVKPDDIVTLFSTYKKKREDVLDILREATKVVNKAADLISDDWIIFAKSGQGQKIQELSERVTELRNELERTNTQVIAKGKVDVFAIDANDADKIYSAFKRDSYVSHRGEISKVLYQFENARWEIQYTAIHRLTGGVLDSDIRAYRKYISGLHYICQRDASEMFNAEFQLAYSFLKLIKKSVK